MEKLTRRIEFSNVELAWAVIGEKGAVHIHCSAINFTSGGIEIHSRTPLYDGHQPSEQDCWLIGSGCHHDGSSLQYSERICHNIGYAFNPYRSGYKPNECIWTMLAQEYRSRFECDAEIDWDKSELSGPKKGGE